MPEILINKTKVNVRPYTLKHLLQIMLARQSKDSEKIKQAYNEIIKYCVQDDIYFNLHESKLLLIKLILISEFQHSPEKDYICSECKTEFKVPIDITKIFIDFNGPENLEIVDFKKFLIKFNWPDLWDDDQKDLMVVKCIDKILVGDEELNVDDLTSKELDDLYNAFTPEYLNKIKKNLLNPTQVAVLHAKCPKCGKLHVHKISGLKEFIELL